MLKKTMASNKIIDRLKVIKDLFLEKLDQLLVRGEEQKSAIQNLERVTTDTNQVAKNLETVTVDINQKMAMLLDNQVIFLKLSTDLIQNLRVLNSDVQAVSQTQQAVFDTISQSQQAVFDVCNGINQSQQAVFDTVNQSQQAVFDAVGGIYQSVESIAATEKLIFNDFQTIRSELAEQKEKTAQKLQEIYTDIHNQKFKVVTDQAGFQGIEAELMSYLYSWLPHPRAIDIGANRGDVTERLLATGYEVYAFEPFLPVFEEMNDRLGQNPKFHSFPLAVGSVDEERELHLVTDQNLLQNPDGDPLYPDSDYSLLGSINLHSLPEGLVFSETVPITVKTLASLHRTHELPTEIGLVKIDTEGFDLDVIQGMGEHRYPVVVAEFWDSKFPFGQSGANNRLEDLVTAMNQRDYGWFIVIYRIFQSNDVSYYANQKISIDNSWGNIFFFQDQSLFKEALKWCNAVMPATYFSTNI
jgi:FkbM family methyltransferase